MYRDDDDMVERWCSALRTTEILEPWLTESHADDHYWHDVAQLIVERSGPTPDRESALQAMRSALSETFDGVALIADNGFFRDRLDQRLEIIASAAISATRPKPDNKPALTIDGSQFADFAGFTVEFSKLLTNHTWSGNLDAFNDILRGGFGTPDGGFTLHWSRSDLSRDALGHPATAAILESLLSTCHPTNRERISARLEDARRGIGPTLFDNLIGIIESHGPGGSEADSGVALELE